MRINSQEVHVYGDVWTDRMWGEIHRAEQSGIPVLTDQAQLDRTHGVKPVNSKQADQKIADTNTKKRREPAR